MILSFYIGILFQEHHEHRFSSMYNTSMQRSLVAFIFLIYIITNQKHFLEALYIARLNWCENSAWPFLHSVSFDLINGRFPNYLLMPHCSNNINRRMCPIMLQQLNDWLVIHEYRYIHWILTFIIFKAYFNFYSTLIIS